MTFIRKIRAGLRPLVILIILMGLPACSGYPEKTEVDPSAGRSALDSWLEDTLIPYLVRQLGQHPRFKGQPVLLVGMHGDDVRPRVDDLTAEIRAIIIDALLNEPGLDLAWRRNDHLRQLYQSYEDGACGDYRKVRYYIGLDCGLSRLERKLYVNVRALNLAEKKWVAGFGKSWEGWPTAAQRAALAREQPDEYLRGQRPLPFSDEQPDLLAAYLARNLSCLLQQAASEELVVHVVKPPENAPAVIKTTLELVGKYLARLRGVEVTDDPNQANVGVLVEIHTIHQDLHHIWVFARYRRDEKYLPGAEIEAYVLIDAHEPAPVAGSPNERPYIPLPAVHGISNSSEIIASFDLLTPLNQKSCLTGAPWRSGVRRIEPHDRLPTGSCLAMEISLATPAYVFLVAQDAEGELTQMFPSNCVGFKNTDTQVYPGRRFQFPSLSDSKTGILELAGSPGMERVFAIAMTSRVLADRFAGRLAEVRGLCRLGQRFPDNVTTGNLQRSNDRIYQWQAYLNRLSADNPELVQYREISFWHEPQ
jgi:hypothetical protein